MQKLIIVLLILLSFTLFGSTARNSTLNFRFAVISDSHLDLDAPDKPDYFKLLHQSSDLLSIAIDEINSFNTDEKPSNDIDFVLFCGDNINSRKTDDYKLLAQILGKLSVPFFIVPGDWDYTPDYSPPTLKKYFGINYENLTENITFSDTAIPGVRKYDFSLDIKNKNGDLVHIIGMDNILHFNGDRGSYEQSQLKWLDEDLKTNSEKPVIVFQHCPVLLPYFKNTTTPYESVDWIPFTRKFEKKLNLQLNEYVMHNPWWRNRAADRSEEFLDVIQKYNVPLVLMGDYHLNKKIPYPPNSPTSLLAINPALVSYPCAYTIYDLNDKSVSWDTRQIKKYSQKCADYNRASIEKYNKMFATYGVNPLKWNLDITMQLSWGEDRGDPNDWHGIWYR